MKMLLIDSNNLFALDDVGQMFLDERPNFSFAYEAISYGPNDRTRMVQLEGEVAAAALEQPHIDEIEAFISWARKERGLKIKAVDAAGRYLGEVDSEDPRVHRRVFDAPPNENAWMLDDNDEWQRVFSFDVEGNRVSHKDPAVAGFTTTPPPPRKPWATVRWNAALGAWNYVMLEGAEQVEDFECSRLHDAANIALSSLLWVMQSGNKEFARRGLLIALTALCSVAGEGEPAEKFQGLQDALAAVMAQPSDAAAWAHLQDVAETDFGGFSTERPYAQTLLIQQYLEEVNRAG